MAYDEVGWLLTEIEDMRDDLRSNELTGYYLTKGSNVITSKSDTITGRKSDLILNGGFVSKYPGIATFSVTITNGITYDVSAKMKLKNINGAEIEVANISALSKSQTIEVDLPVEAGSPWYVYEASTTNVGSVNVSTTFAWSVKGTVNKFENAVMTL